MVLTRLNRLLFGVWVPASAQIGRHTRLGYWGLAVVIHSRAVIGERCLIGQGTTIGRNLGDRDVPTLEDDVYVGAGSVIIGPIRIGAGAIIGANSVVNRDVPRMTIVAGNTARVIGSTHGKRYWEIDSLDDS